MFILVALGKVGGEKSVKEILRLTNRYDLRLSDVLHALWAFGKLAGVSRVYGNPLPRSVFKDTLNFLSIILQSQILHHQIHLYCLFAIGEICDQRQASGFPDQVDPAQVRHFRLILPSFITRIEKRKTKYTDKLIRIANAILLMLKGETLSDEQERILLTIRNLLVPNLEALEGTDTIFNLKNVIQEPITEQPELLQKEPSTGESEKKQARQSIRDFFK